LHEPHTLGSALANEISHVLIEGDLLLLSSSSGSVIRDRDSMSDSHHGRDSPHRQLGISLLKFPRERLDIGDPVQAAERRSNTRQPPLLRQLMYPHRRAIHQACRLLSR